MPQPVIHFPCRCGHRFALGADMAAGIIQCPRCGLLNDVPTLSDLQSIEDDGTLRLKTDDARPRANRVAETDLHFRPRRVDDLGREIDLRPTQRDLSRIDSAEIPFADAPTAGHGKAKPKYDPVTGELIQPLAIAQPTEPDYHDVPVARRAISYAAGDTRHAMTAGRIFVKLFEPANAVVLFFIFVFYVLWQVVGALMAGVLAMLGLPWTAANIPMAFLVMAHYVNTLDDTGPQAMDELPRPLRSLSWADDIWGPFFRMAVSLFVCLGPAYVAANNLPPRYLAAALVPAVLGLFFFPAVLLTMATSGTFLNLRPDRLMGVVRAAGPRYPFAFLLWLAALPLFAFSLGNVYLIPGWWRDEHEWVWNVNKAYLGFPLVFLSIILMHFACWYLGVIYQHCHARFPWVLQQHVSARREAEKREALEARMAARRNRYTRA